MWLEKRTIGPKNSTLSPSLCCHSFVVSRFVAIEIIKCIWHFRPMRCSNGLNKMTSILHFLSAFVAMRVRECERAAIKIPWNILITQMICSFKWEYLGMLWLLLLSVVLSFFLNGIHDKNTIKHHKMWNLIFATTSNSLTMWYSNNLSTKSEKKNRKRLSPQIDAKRSVDVRN